MRKSSSFFLFNINKTRINIKPILELRGITKRFPGVLANDQIDLTSNEGEIHALLGENGAGQSTLMNILYGLIDPDEGLYAIQAEADLKVLNGLTFHETKKSV